MWLIVLGLPYLKLVRLAMGLPTGTNLVDLSRSETTVNPNRVDQIYTVWLIRTVRKADAGFEIFGTLRQTVSPIRCRAINLRLFLSVAIVERMVGEARIRKISATSGLVLRKTEENI